MGRADRGGDLAADAAPAAGDRREPAGHERLARHRPAGDLLLERCPPAHDGGGVAPRLRRDGGRASDRVRVVVRRRLRRRSSVTRRPRSCRTPRRGDFDVTLYVVWEAHAHLTYSAWGVSLGDIDLGTVTLPETRPYHVAEIRAVLRTTPTRAVASTSRSAERGARGIVGGRMFQHGRGGYRRVRHRVRTRSRRPPSWWARSATARRCTS